MSAKKTTTTTTTTTTTRKKEQTRYGAVSQTVKEAASYLITGGAFGKRDVPHLADYHSDYELVTPNTRSLVAVEPRRPPMTDVGTETTFRLDQRTHFQKSKHLLRSEVS